MGLLDMFGKITGAVGSVAEGAGKTAEMLPWIIGGVAAIFAVGLVIYVTK